MDLHEHFGLEYETGARRGETGLFIPLKCAGNVRVVFR